MIPYTVLCIFATAMLIYSEHAGTRADKLRAGSKVIASSSFIIVGVMANTGTAYSGIVITGLVLGAIGDVALLGRSSRAFLAGLVAFLLGHVAYVVAAAAVAPVGTWLSPLAVIPVVVSAVALGAWLWPHLGSMRIPVIAYVLTITMMVIGAFAVPNRLFMVGAVLFYASDLAVAREKFVAPGFINKAVGLPAYFAGQLLIAWSISSS